MQIHSASVLSIYLFASLGKPQMCWSWTLLQVPQAPLGGPQRHLCGSRSVQGEKSMGQLRHLEKLHPIQPIHHLSPPQQETGTTTLRVPHFWQLHPKNSTKQAGNVPGSQSTQFPPFPSLSPPAPHLLPAKRGTGLVAALGEQLENGKTGGNFVGLITQSPSVSVLLSPSQFFPL